MPRRDLVYQGGERPHEPLGAKIEFVRVAAGEITGKIAPYPDPEMPCRPLAGDSGRLEAGEPAAMDGGAPTRGGVIADRASRYAPPQIG